MCPCAGEGGLDEQTTTTCESKASKRAGNVGASIAGYAGEDSEPRKMEQSE